jgi:hypothetical protein
MAEADCLGVLYGRKLISEDAFRAGRNYALLTALARRSWGLSEGSVNALWHRLISGTVEDIGTPRPVWADSSTDSIELARMALARRRQVLTEAGLHVLFVVNSVCVDNYWSKQLKRLVNGQPGKRGTGCTCPTSRRACIGSPSCGLRAAVRLCRRRRRPSNAQRPGRAWMSLIRSAR